MITSKRNLRKANEIHSEFVDDLTLAETIDLSEQLVKVPDEERPQSDNYHARTVQVLPLNNSKVFRQLEKTKFHS